jgi:hypothetical protein
LFQVFTHGAGPGRQSAPMLKNTRDRRAARGARALTHAPRRTRLQKLRNPTRYLGILTSEGTNDQGDTAERDTPDMGRS